MKPVIIDLPHHTKNDTWEGLIVGPVLFNDATPTYPLSSCRLDFRDNAGDVGQSFNSQVVAGSSLITISNSATWEVAIPAQVVTLTTGTWNWDFETRDTNGVIRTLYSGTMRIIDDITY